MVKPLKIRNINMLRFKYYRGCRWRKLPRVFLLTQYELKKELWFCLIMHTPQKTSLQWQNRRICAGNTSSSFLDISNTFKHQWLCYRLRLCGFTYERPKHNRSSPRPVYCTIFTDVLHTKTKQWRTLNWLAVQPDQFLGLQEQKQPSQMQKLLKTLSL